MAYKEHSKHVIDCCASIKQQHIKKQVSKKYIIFR